MTRDPAKNFTYPAVNKNLRDLNPIVFGEETCLPLHSFGPVTFGHYLIHYVVSGKGTLWLRNEKYEITKNTAFLIKPGEMAKYTADKKDPWHYIWIGFTGELTKKFDELVSPVIEIETELFSEMREVRFLSNTEEEFLAGKLFLYYSLLFSSKEKIDYISRITNYVNACYTDFNCTVQRISEVVGLEKHYMARIFKVKTGKTLKTFLTEKRMKNARNLLQNGCDVKTAAAMSGYCDQFSFSKAFKKFYGIPPAACKNSASK